MPFLSPNQQCESAEGKNYVHKLWTYYDILTHFFFGGGDQTSQRNAEQRRQTAKTNNVHCKQFKLCNSVPLNTRKVVLLKAHTNLLKFICHQTLEISYHHTIIRYTINENNFVTNNSTQMQKRDRKTRYVTWKLIKKNEICHATKNIQIHCWTD